MRSVRKQKYCQKEATMERLHWKWFVAALLALALIAYGAWGLVSTLTDISSYSTQALPALGVPAGLVGPITAILVVMGIGAFFLGALIATAIVYAQLHRRPDSDNQD